MTRDEAIHVIQFAASQLQTSNMRLSERLMEALNALEAGDDVTLTRQMIIHVSPENIADGIAQVIRSVNKRREERSTLPYRLQIDLSEAFGKFVEIRAQWTEDDAARTANEGGGHDRGY